MLYIVLYIMTRRPSRTSFVRRSISTSSTTLVMSLLRWRKRNECQSVDPFAGSRRRGSNRSSDGPASHAANRIRGSGQDRSVEAGSDAQIIAASRVEPLERRVIASAIAGRARPAASEGATDYERFTIVGDLLRQTVAAPQLRAALYRVAAGLGGVELVGSMTDRAGRTGKAVSMTNDQSSRGLERRVLIFDPETSVLLAEEGVLLQKVDWLDAEPPLVIGYNTYLISDIVPTIQ